MMIQVESNKNLLIRGIVMWFIMFVVATWFLSDYASKEGHLEKLLYYVTIFLYPIIIWQIIITIISLIKKDKLVFAYDDKSLKIGSNKILFNDVKKMIVCSVFEPMQTNWVAAYKFISKDNRVCYLVLNYWIRKEDLRIFKKALEDKGIIVEGNVDEKRKKMLEEWDGGYREWKRNSRS